MNPEENQSMLCANISYLRKKHGLSKREMAHILRVGFKTLNAMEEGVLPRRLGSSVLIRASDYFGVSTDRLCRCCLNCASR